ncbi:MAG: enoyl-CoA hydratase/isomerase family protein [Nitrososphaerota archaeon]|nr:enoyl-CoA hydratase/isomerase family protein [Nitrososphaerota archaeon]
MQIETKEENRVFWVVLNRPEKANAIDRAMWKSISDSLDEGAASSSSRVIALTGKGKNFSSGADMADLAKASTHTAAFEFLLGTIRPVFDRILRSPKPVVAAVNGPAVGGGAELVFACDMAVANPDAYFSLAQGKYGIGPALGLTFGVPVLGRKRLAEMALTGRRVSSSEAERWGLINSVAEGKLEAAVEKLAEHVSETPPTLIRAMKEVLLRQMTLAGYESAFSYFAMFSQSQEAKAGTERFLSKKK